MVIFIRYIIIICSIVSKEQNDRQSIFIHIDKIIENHPQTGLSFAPELYQSGRGDWRGKRAERLCA